MSTVVPASPYLLSCAVDFYLFDEGSCFAPDVASLCALDDFHKWEISSLTFCLLLFPLQSSLKSSSEHLHSSLNGRMYFASFDVILPSNWWSNGCVTNTHANANVTNYNGAPTDVKITARHDIFGDEPWTLQTGGCGEKGDQIYVAYKSVEDQKISEKFVLEWMKYRYGVFDIDGFESDSLYPPCGRNDSELHPVCNEVKKIDANPSQTFYSSHHSSLYSGFHYASPSKHNFLCNRKNPIDVIMSHPDFNETAVFQSTVSFRFSAMTRQDFLRSLLIPFELNSIIAPFLSVQAHNAPTIRYVKKALTRYMVIIDDHIDLNVRDSFQFLRDAMRKWIEKDLPNKETEVGIWLMGNATKSEDVKRNLIKSLHSSLDREEIFSTLPWYIEYRSSPKCQIHAAVTESVALLKRRAASHGNANSVILIIAPGMFKCSEESTLSMTNAVNEANIKITTINYPNIPTNRIELDQLAQKTGGKSYTIVEERQNEEHSLLTTFFQLTNTLMAIR
jgi:calcium-activated chloride channel regulator 3/4